MTGPGQAFAKRYVDLVESLVAEGVREETARGVAERAAVTLLMDEIDYASVGACPNCGVPL